MLENDLRAMFEWQATADQPPAQISLPVARRRALPLHRWRRAAALGAPIVAAAAAVAIGLTASLLSGTAATRPAQPSHGSQVGSSQFNPLVPYAAFGWLPAGQQENGGRSSLGVLDLNADPGGLLDLVVYYPGQCRLTAARLTCGSALTGGGMVLTGRAPDVGGQAAYWGRELPAQLTEPYLPSGYPKHGRPLLLPMLAFRDPQGGWALLVYPEPAIKSTLRGMTYPSRSAVVRIADNVRFGQTTPLVFPARLTGLPRQWRTVQTVNFTRDGRSLRGFLLRLGPPAGAYSVPHELYLDLNQGGGLNPCQTGVTCEMIDGYRVALAHWGAQTASGPPVPVYALTAADADGVLVSITVTGPRPPLSPAQIFADHLQLLGPDPANWKTLFAP